nr:unnamed protein product [Callosobruchus chinensis]
MIGNYSIILRLGEQWNISDWKTLANEIFKKPDQWHFRYNQSKRFILTKSSNKFMIRSDAFYRPDFGVPKTVTKEETWTAYNQDHYGQDWRNNLELEFYEIIDGEGETVKEGSQDGYEYEDEAAAMML